MSKVAIVTDSTNCLPPSLIKEYNIKVVPFQLILEGKVYIDQVDITPTEFWKKFKELKNLPTTGVPSPGSYASAFSELAKSTDSIVGVIISKALTGAYQSAQKAIELVKEEYPKLNIELVDTNTAAGALGFIVLEAARSAQMGKSLGEVVKITQEMSSKVKYLAAFDTLKYLIRGGRAPKTAVIGEIVGVKPLIGIVTGTGLVDSLGRVRGRDKSLLKLVDMIKEYIDVSKPVHVNVHYTDDIKVGERLREMVTSTYQCEEVLLTNLTPVMAAHTGPMVGMGFYS